MGLGMNASGGGICSRVLMNLWNSSGSPPKPVTAKRRSIVECTPAEDCGTAQEAFEPDGERPVSDEHGDRLQGHFTGGTASSLARNRAAS
jgi:hypothetical protein